VALHVAAIVFYRVARKRDLLGPMIRGDALVPGDWPASRDDAMLRLRALAVAAACAGAVAWLVS
jgi:hypothetical protein